MLILAYPGVEAYHRDGYALDFLTNLLAGDKKSPLYKVLVEERKLAPEVEMFNYQLEISGMIVFDAKTFPGVKLDDVKAAYDEALARFERDGIDPKDLERYKITEETRTYNRLTSTNGKALAMAHDNVFGGTPDRMLKELDAYRSVTADDVMRVYEKIRQRPQPTRRQYLPGRRSLSGADRIDTDSTRAGDDRRAADERRIGSRRRRSVRKNAVAVRPQRRTGPAA